MATKYEEYLARADEERIEFIDGEIVVLTQPNSVHSEAASNLLEKLKDPFQRGNGGPGGWWLFQETELTLEGRTFRPDLFGIRKERLPKIPKKHTLSPDWICEVISGSNAKYDWGKKGLFYAEAKIPYYWILDPRLSSRTLTALKLEPDQAWKIIGVFDEEERAAKIPPFEEIPLDISTLFYPKELLEETEE